MVVLARDCSLSSIPSLLQFYLPRTHSGKIWFHHMGCNRKCKLLWHPLVPLSWVALPSLSFTFNLHLLTESVFCWGEVGACLAFSLFLVLS